mgnify:FL=1|jgi:hypothetical protein|tara:strand:+ start:2892 stop:3938 length:1047 start_codon:yes stop_codon:yes gene_type:complete
MANKSVYQDFDTDALTYFGLEQDTIYGVLSGSGEVNKVLCTQDQTTYDKINTILTVPTEDDQTFRTKKKAFILPKCNVSQDRLKAALKEHGITVTNDYELADLIIGHEDISTHRLENADNIPSTVMMNKLWNYETTKGRASATHSKEVAIYNSGLEVILTPKLTESVRYYDLDIETSLYDEWMLTGMAINLAHIIDTTDVSVIDPETVLHASANKMILDEQLLADLKVQLDSSRYNEDRILALKIIPTICYKTNYHLLWQFAQDCSMITYADNRDKDLQYWIDASEFTKLERRSAQDMILWLDSKDKLDTVSFRYLEPIVRREISIHNRDLYTFKVAVKKEYQKYLKK